MRVCHHKRNEESITCEAVMGSNGLANIITPATKVIVCLDCGSIKKYALVDPENK